MDITEQLGKLEEQLSKIPEQTIAYDSDYSGETLDPNFERRSTRFKKSNSYESQFAALDSKISSASGAQKEKLIKIKQSLSNFQKDGLPYSDERMRAAIQMGMKEHMTGF